MKCLKFIPILLFALIISTQLSASTVKIDDKKTAETVFVFAENMETLDAEALRAEVEGLSSSEKTKLLKMAIEEVEQAKLSGSDVPLVVLYILAIFIPPLAVAIHTDLGMETLWNILWCCFFWIPGIIHAFIVLAR